MLIYESMPLVVQHSFPNISNIIM